MSTIWSQTSAIPPLSMASPSFRQRHSPFVSSITTTTTTTATPQTAFYSPLPMTRQHHQEPSVQEEQKKQIKRQLSLKQLENIDNLEELDWLHAAAATALASANETLPQPPTSTPVRQPQSQQLSPSPLPLALDFASAGSPWHHEGDTYSRLGSPPPLSLAPSQSSTIINHSLTPTSPPQSPSPGMPVSISHHSPSARYSHFLPSSPTLSQPGIFRSPSPPPRQDQTTILSASPVTPSPTLSQAGSPPLPQGHPAAHPTRSILVRSVPLAVPIPKAREILEAFGPLRDFTIIPVHRPKQFPGQPQPTPLPSSPTVQLSPLSPTVTSVRATYYDLRHAERALNNLNDIHQWNARFVPSTHLHARSPPARNDDHFQYHSSPSPPPPPPHHHHHHHQHHNYHHNYYNNDGGVVNMGTLVVFNLDATTTSEQIKQLFSRYGDVKEIRETPNKRHHKFVEFYDVRDADRAMKQLNRCEINGKKIKIEISRPGGRGIVNNKPGYFGGNVGAGRCMVNGSVECCNGTCTAGGVGGTAIGNGIVGSPRRRLSLEKIGGDGNGVVMKSHMHSAGGFDKVNTKFALDIDKVKRGEDLRTALMIRNIPNKYNQKMLVATLEENNRGRFDFIYLPIDFKNKCNVGYAFINFIQPWYIPEFYKEFHGKKWGRFNSEKVCCITYARIQGKANLIAHFQNSSLMNEDPKCQPVVFDAQGRREEFPVGTHVRTRRGPSAREARSLENSPHCSPQLHHHHHHHHHYAHPHSPPHHRH